MNTLVAIRSWRAEPAQSLWPMAPVLVAVLAILPASIASIPCSQPETRVFELAASSFVPNSEEIECDSDCDWPVYIDCDFEPRVPPWFAVWEPLSEIKLNLALFRNW